MTDNYIQTSDNGAGITTNGQVIAVNQDEDRIRAIWSHVKRRVDPCKTYLTPNWLESDTYDHRNLYAFHFSRDPITYNIVVKCDGVTLETNFEFTPKFLKNK